MSILETKEISKQYPGTLALNQVSVSFESGKINALVGKNGSGKSTLVNIFSGAVKQTSGQFFLDGKELSFSSPEDAQNHGVATVYQELSLIPGLTVAENIFIGRLPVKGFSIDWKKTYKMAQDLLDELGIDISPKEVISNLTAWQCQMVEIAKAMSHNPKILQLDEPTSSLAQNEVESLFKIIRNYFVNGTFLETQVSLLLWMLPIILTIFLTNKVVHIHQELRCSTSTSQHRANHKNHINKATSKRLQIGGSR